MSIYTRTGDTGTTRLANGTKVSKADLIIEACGCLDELSSFIGAVIVEKKIADADNILLTNIQQSLHKIMAYLALADVDLQSLSAYLKIIEQKIDNTLSKQKKIDSFILPQGSPLTTKFHIVRTVCRRAERAVVRVVDNRKLNLNLIISYLNRLSDLFFVLARVYNNQKEITI